MHHRLHISILGSLLSLLTACATPPCTLPVPLLAATEGALAIGISTKYDAFRRFGQPSNVRYAEGTAQWIYLAVTPATDMRVPFPRTGHIQGANMMETQALTLHFQRGVLRRHAYVHHSYDRTTFGGLLYDIRQAPQVEEAHVREEMTKLGVPFDMTAWDATCATLNMWPATTPMATPAIPPQ